MAQDESQVSGRSKDAGAVEADGHQPAGVRTYLVLMLVCIAVVLTFAMIQHLVVLGIPLRDIRPPWLIVPSIVGGLFGYLLAKVRILHQRSRHQLELIMQRDRTLQQEISMRKAVEESLRDQQRRLETANRELKAFSYSVSHDLRSPLRTISGFTQALAEECGGTISDDARHYVDRIQNACRRMDEMIDSLLILSRVSSADVVFVEVNLSDIAREILTGLAEQEPMRNVTVEIAPDLVVNGDHSLLRVVMENLLGNAWKFTARADMAVICFKAASREGRKVYCVEDNGAGFDADYADQLFSPFNRLHNQEDYPGTGIGLATVQRALHRLGGEIRAEGREGHGAKFCFTL